MLYCELPLCVYDARNIIYNTDIKQSLKCYGFVKLVRGLVLSYREFGWHNSLEAFRRDDSMRDSIFSTKRGICSIGFGRKLYLTWF